MKNEIKQKILDYLNDNLTRFGDKSRLKVLDNKYKKSYSGVTLNYITYDLLKAKYKKHIIAECLLELYDNKDIKGLHCPDIKKVVFESKKSTHWTFRDEVSGWANRDDKNTLEYFEKYMNKFIKK